MEEKKVTYEEALAVCVQYYVDKGYSVEHSTAYVSGEGEKDVFRVYELIQEEKNLPIVSTPIDIATMFKP